jgi:hypothetical protein
MNNMKTFKDLEFIEHPNHIGGIRASIMFENGYGASIIKSNFTYGGKMGLYELAVVDSDGDVVYDTPVARGIIGYLREEDVTEGMRRIQLLQNAQ